MIQITLANPQVGIQPGPNGLKLLIFVDTPSGIQVIIPLSPEDSRRLGTTLSATIEVAPPGATVKDIVHA